MNLRGLERLSCPDCGARLELSPFREERVEFSDEELTGDTKFSGSLDSVSRIIRDGVLLCGVCRVWYPIYSYVPVMLIFKTPFHFKFFKIYQKELDRLKGFEMPNQRAEPGEASIQETFTEEWDTLTDDELSFTYTKEELKQLHRQVWLKWPKQPPQGIGSIINVGCGGMAAEAKALYDISNAEVFAIDLSFSLFRAAGEVAKKPFLHLVIASLFHIPFSKESFDLVYSQGVLHHTYSTQAAFKSIIPFAKKGGDVFIWVYAIEDHLVYKGLIGLISRLKYSAEELFLRPVISRLPVFLRSFFINIISILLHILILMRMRNKDAWRFNNTRHGIRDWLTPRYAYRHSFNEVIEWFEEEGFTYDLHSPLTYRRLFGKRLTGIGVLGRRKEE